MEILNSIKISKYLNTNNCNEILEYFHVFDNKITLKKYEVHENNMINLVINIANELNVDKICLYNLDTSGNGYFDKNPLYNDRLEILYSSLGIFRGSISIEINELRDYLILLFRERLIFDIIFNFDSIISLYGDLELEYYSKLSIDHINKIKSLENNFSTKINMNHGKV